MRRPGRWLGLLRSVAVVVSLALQLAGCGSGKAGACAAGGAGCACKADGSCDPDLVCAGTGTCQARVCAAGTESCACNPDGSCSTGLVCAGNACVKAACGPGQSGCPCKGDGTCTEGVCSRGFCVASDSVRAPASAACFTPCTASATLASGSYGACSAEGLMAGCVDGKTCVGGSCVAPGSSAPTCTKDLECPDFQACIEGRCYSNCNADSDCSSGRKCHRHVCRTACTARVDSCPTGTACVTTDGENGHCVPVRPSEGTTAPAVSGSFSLSPESVAFSNTKIRETITIRNDAPIGLEFTVRKLDHTEFKATGPVHVEATPLSWLALGAGAAPARVQELKVFVDGNGGTAKLELASAANPDLARWEGRIEIANPTVGRRTVFLGYTSKPEGRWTGKMHYFASFGDANLDAWTRSRDDAGALQQVGNAFVQRWGALRQGRISYDEFQAVVTATVTGSWSWASVRDACKGTAAACYLYDRTPGFAAYSDSLDTYPIPTASSELPVAVNLHASAGDPLALTGKIVTSESLHYAGDPAITLSFAADPSACSSTVSSACLAPLRALSSVIRIGGRYVTTSTDNECSRTPGGSFRKERIPWLVPGFAEGTELEGTTNLRYRHECRDKLLPFGGAIGSEAQNASLAQSNPIPDGRPRVRTLELVDGALVNQDTLFIIFRERFEASFLGADDPGFKAYGFMSLKRSPVELDAAAYQGSATLDPRAAATGVLDTACRPELVAKVLGAGAALTDGNASALAIGILDGFGPGPRPDPIPASGGAELVHYLCHQTGLFDGGPDDRADRGEKRACPAGSHVTFFTTTAAMDRNKIADEPCQKDGSCQVTLDRWIANNLFELRLNPVWRCTRDNQVNCSENRQDLRDGKSFYPRGAATAVFLPLANAIDEAFRYKTAFRSRTGSSVGFTPEICVPNSNAIPYCYDPPAIEEARARVDCALDLFSRRTAAPDQATRDRLKKFLVTSFGYTTETSAAGNTITLDGFEKLNAELLIMLGDDAYTRAFASRFDLAGSRMRSFEGSKLEPGGIDLAGGAGAEMYSLYQAAQYYGLVLDRFYAMSPFVWRSLGAGQDNFVTQATVEAYFDRLIRASTQKARAWSEVAKRYQAFNRPDLARRVAERAYAAAYLESVVISRLMLGVVTVSKASDRDQIVRKVELAALGYRAALLDMRDVYGQIKDDPTFFGYAPDFVPIPAIEPGDVNAFTKLLASAKASAAAAARKEELALAQTRAFDTDAAQFQAELVKLRNNYENQLADVCGTFLGSDGVVHPAIRAYGELGEVGKALGDPCGFVGNGRIHAAVGGLETLQLELKKVAQRYDKVFEEVDLEVERVNKQCAASLALADYKWKQAGRVNDLSSSIAASKVALSAIGRQVQKVQSVVQFLNCSVGSANSCGGAVAGAAIVGVASEIADIASTGLEIGIAASEGEIAELQRTTARWETLHQCDVLKIDSDATVKRLLLELKELDLDALKTEYQLALAAAEIDQLRNQATRLQAEQEEMEQQTINVEAARNDPNVRIYKNDAVILADETFQLAVRNAYEATKVFEFYTSQSYARLGELFLIRMVSHGDYNLESYLAELETAYRDFQQAYGNPDTRVEIVSLRDDVLAIPRLGPSGCPLTQEERIARFRERLTSGAYVDERGYVSVPFATSLARLSPLTRNHKILALEAEIIGAAVGDTLGRVYVRQRGTGMVLSVTGDKSYYRLPERTAVLNPLFNGVRVFGNEVYRSDRLRDRPFVNTHWELVLNQKDELANQDIDLRSLTDVRLYVYYTDFTRL